MNTYGWLLMGQTLLALLALALCGGWVLWPFRRAERPYLWLAAPLAGVFALGGVLTALYFFAGLPFRWCVWGSLAANALGTVGVLARNRPARPALGRRAVATVVVLAAAYWATRTCNTTAIDAREPTIAALDGSDMFGYPIVGDWVRAHPARERPGTTDPFEVFPHVNLFVDGGRPLAHLLAGAAGEVRGTSSLFSYDWTTGVLLAAGVLAFGGTFAATGPMLVLLVVGAGVSNWLPNARTGYLGRTLAYPGSVMLAGLFLAAADRLTRGRLAALAALGFAVSFSLAPVFVAAVLGLVAAGYVGAVGLAFLAARFRDRGAPFRARVARPAGAVLLLYAAAVGPAFLAFYAPRDAIAVPGVPTNWSVVLPVSLDLEPPALPLLKPETDKKLLYGSAAVLLALLGLALWSRQRVATALVGFALVIPGSWLFGVNLLHTFQGVIYPLTLAGAAALVAPAAVRWGRTRTAVVAVLMVAAIGLRVPQGRATTDRYVTSVQPYRTIALQSDAVAIRRIVGGDAVDVVLGHCADNHLVIVELGVRGTAMQFRPPTWERSLKNWARHVQCPAPDLYLPKARFTILEKNAYAPPETVRWVGSRLKLVEDRDAVTVLGVADAQEIIWDPEWRPGAWIGNTKTTFLIHNGTGRPRCVRLVADTSAGPAHPDRDRRTLCYALGDSTGKLALPKENVAAIPLHLAPGLNRVELFVEEAAVPAPQPGGWVPLLAFRNWRLEPTETGSRHDQR